MKHPLPNVTQLLKILRIVLIIEAVSAIVIVAYLWSTNSANKRQLDVVTTTYPEVTFLNTKKYNFNQYKEYFVALAEEKGGEYAFDVMKRTTMMPNIDTHLIGHDIGEVLYKQQGIEAMKVCTDDFKSACSHSIILGYLHEKKEPDLPEIQQVCERAPGKTNGYAQCFHGFGHAILAYKGYSIEDAVNYCINSGTKARKSIETRECIGGMIMEIMTGGGHDTVAWKIQRAKYVSSTDPLSLCKSTLIPENGKNSCYIYSTSQMYKSAKSTDVNNMSDEHITKAMRYCITISVESQKKSCYHGFGISFVGQTSAIDFTRVALTSDSELKQIYHRCNLTIEEIGRETCIKASVQNLYWSGKNEINTAIKFCELIQNTKDKEYCFTALITRAKASAKSQQYYKESCSKFPTSYRNQCIENLVKYH